MYELGQYLVNEPAQNDVSDTCHPLLACPARFERATYALEEFVAAQKYNKFNDLDT
jgi:hypothetical protein